MAAAALKELCELDELKKNTAVTRNILSSAEKLLALGDKDENITRLMTAVKRAYHHMLQAVSKYKLSTTKKNRLWKRFHSFSVKGHRMCKECDDSLGLKAHDTFWQLLLEQEFITCVSDYLRPPSLDSCDTSTAGGKQQLTYIEENAVRYTAGYLLRKLERKYSKRKDQIASQFTAVLQEMAGSYPKRPPATEQRHQSSDWTFLVDCGGLYHVDDSVYNLFVALELTVDEQLSVIFQSKGRGIEKVEKENLKWLYEDEEIQHSRSLCTGVSGTRAFNRHFSKK